MDFQVGQFVMWRGGWGKHAPQPAKIIGIGVELGEVVYDLDNRHWAYADQLSPIEGASEEGLTSKLR